VNLLTVVSFSTLIMCYRLAFTCSLIKDLIFRQTSDYFKL